MKKIVVADDEIALRFLLSETLADEGYAVTEAQDGREAMNKLGEDTFDAIILDYLMPEHTGIEVCEWLRNTSNKNHNTPVILLTAKTQHKDREKASQVGVTTYMIKPFSPLQLLDVLEDML